MLPYGSYQVGRFKEKHGKLNKLKKCGKTKTLWVSFTGMRVGLEFFFFFFCFKYICGLKDFSVSVKLTC